MKDKQLSLFDTPVVDYRKALRPERTAMHRGRESPIARALVESGLLDPKTTGRVLDYGCGVGADVRFYGERGFEAVGFDPFEAFGFAAPPQGAFDAITCLFVLNVCSHQDRIAVAGRVQALTRPGGLIVVATRSSQAISREAANKGWEPFADGYLSSPSKGTFQRGIDEDELAGYFAGPGIARLASPLNRRPDATTVILRRSD